MYHPEQYLSLELLASEMAEFSWPASFELEDELPDGIIVAFPNSNFFFREGFEGDVEVQFLPEDTGSETPLNLKHALSVLVPDESKGVGLEAIGVNENLSPYASEAKTRAAIHNQCLLIQAYLHPVIAGDFSWVEKYLSRAGAKP